MDKIFKYPRTQHIQGSRLQTGDDDHHVPFKTIVGHYIVVEEKLDGANTGISFDNDGNLLLQSRGHYLTGGPRERHFNLLKTWANRHMNVLFDILENNFIMYGEFLYAKHSSFYDNLNHYFYEFDIMEKSTGKFLSTEERRKKIGTAPIVSVPVLWEGIATTLEHIQSFIQPSLYKTANWRDKLQNIAIEKELNPELVIAQTFQSNFSEGLYLKQEANGEVIGRYKHVRHDFIQSIMDSETHWLDRPIIPNQLAPGVDIFSDNKPF